MSGHVSADDDGDGGHGALVEGDDRPFHVGREGIDGVDPVFDVVEELAWVVAFFDFDFDFAATFGGIAADFADAGEVADGVFEFDDDAFFDFSGCCAAVGHGDADLVGFVFGEVFDGDFFPCEEGSEEEHEPHEEVRGHVVAGEPFDH